jgi:hypothetical protein
MSRILGLAAGLILLLAAAPGEALDSPAYARLLETHVRPGTIDGVRLTVVDYSAIKGDGAYARALQDLATARLDGLGSEAARIAFWVNAYNLLAIKAVVDQYPVTSIKDGSTLLRSIWKKPIGTVAGREYALDDVEHGILRKDFREPRIHVAIACASLSCPDLRAEPYVGARLDAQLDDAAQRFLGNPTKGLVRGADGKSARVSSIFKWFRDDFAVAGGVARFIRAKAGPALAAQLAGLADSGLGYLDYDWSLNDAARAR